MAFCCLVGLVVAGLVVAGSVEAGSAEAGVPEIVNPAEAPLVRTIEMQEAWRVGGEPDEEFVLGVITEVFTDQAGHIYLFDLQQEEVFQFDAQGNYLKSALRQGQGPGEIRSCFYCNSFQGTEVGCLSGNPQRIVKVDAEGIPQDDIHLQPMDQERNLGHLTAYQFLARDGYLVASGTFNRYEPEGRKSWRFLSAFDAQGQEIHEFGIQPSGYDFSKPILVDEEKDFWPLGNWTLGPGGQVYTAPRRSAYYLEVHDSQGNLLRAITRPWPLRKRTPEEKQEAKSNYSFLSEKELPPISYRMSDFDAVVKNLFWVEDHLWVITNRYEKTWRKDRTGFIDVLDAEGHLLESRAYAVPVRRDKDQVFWLGDDKVAVVRNIEAAMMNANTGWYQQEGEDKAKPSPQEDDLLEVILYRAR